MEPTIVRWPEENDRRAAALANAEPCLLIVADGDDPPELLGCLEDWVRASADPQEKEARTGALAARADRHALDGDLARPVIDEGGIVRFRGRHAVLPPIETELVRPLVDRFMAVVGREALIRSAWPGASPRRNALDVHLVRIRRRLEPAGLQVRTVRARGYLLEPCPATFAAASSAVASSGR